MPKGIKGEPKESWYHAVFALTRPEVIYPPGTIDPDALAVGECYVLDFTHNVGNATPYAAPYHIVALDDYQVRTRTGYFPRHTFAHLCVCGPYVEPPTPPGVKG